MKCERCKIHIDGTFGSGRFCSWKCSNTRVHSEDTKRRISESIKKLDLKHNIKRKHSKQARVNMSKGTQKYWDKILQEKIKVTLFEKLPQRYRYKVLFDERGYVCEECGFKYFDERRKKGPYEVHHIDGNIKNNKKENLKILCLICHWKTDNWRFRDCKHTQETKKKIGLTTKQRKPSSWLKITGT